MKREATVGSVLFVLFLVSVFPTSIYSGTVNSHSNSALGAQSTVDPVDWWPMFHHDLTHTGYSTSTAPNTNQTLWNYTTSWSVSSSPAVAGGIVYMGLGRTVYALNAATGAYIWSYTTGELVQSSPAVAGGMVYVGSNDDNVYALNATTGAYIWNYTTGWAVYSSPAVAGGMVYVGSMDNKVYALNATTGALVWNYTVSRYFGVTSSPAVAGGIVYVGSDDYDVYALNATTGAYIWSYTTSYPVGSPAVAGGVVYVGSNDDNVYALNASTGAYIWSYTTGWAAAYSSPAVAGGIVYVGSDDNNVYALNATTGAQVWSYATGGFVDSSPAVAGRVVYVGSFDGKVYALNASTGAYIWSYTTGGQVYSSPAVAGGIVYVGSNDMKVYAFGSVHDVAATDVTSSKTVVGRSGSLDITVTVADLGNYPETFNVTVYANTTSVASQNVTLSSGTSANMIFTWDTAGFAYGKYTISAYAWPVPGETNTANNNLTGGNVIVTILGDINGDFTVNNTDAVMLANSFGRSIGQTGFNPNADFDDNGVVNILDAITLATHYDWRNP